MFKTQVTPLYEVDPAAEYGSRLIVHQKFLDFQQRLASRWRHLFE